MANVILHNAVTPEEKFDLMREDARFDVADVESVQNYSIPEAGWFRRIRSPKAPPTVPKVFLSNHCTFNCAYCGCRVSNEQKRRYCNSPRELAELSVQAAKENGHGVFLTSAIYRNADYTEELIVETLRIMRQELFYKGYIHAKVMPGTDPVLIEQAGRYANRLSVNIEVARSEGYEKIAKQKNKANILTPMGQISQLIQAAQTKRHGATAHFATSQTTQLMAGSTQETDRTILQLSKALYRKYQLKRVYYTAFQYEYPANGYDLAPVSTPQWRVYRLYQADRLLQLYGFSPDELTPEEDPNLREDWDPKVRWAIRNLSLFPVEVNTADAEMLLRVPGIGLVSLQKILEARKQCKLTHSVLRQMGVSLKRSVYFITCNGTYLGGNFPDKPESVCSLFASQEQSQLAKRTI